LYPIIPTFNPVKRASTNGRKTKIPDRMMISSEIELKIKITAKTVSGLKFLFRNFSNLPKIHSG